MKFKTLCKLVLVTVFAVGIYAIKDFDAGKPLPTYCAFCNPQVLENQSFYEDDLVRGLLTHRPYSPGHSLVIPKRHVERFEQLTEAETNRMMSVIKKIHQAVCQIHETSSYMLWQRNGQESFMSVPHVHFHYIPRPTGECSYIAFQWKIVLAGLKSPLSIEVLKYETQRMRAAMDGQLVAAIPAVA